MINTPHKREKKYNLTAEEDKIYSKFMYYIEPSRQDPDTLCETQNYLKYIKLLEKLNVGPMVSQSNWHVLA